MKYLIVVFILVVSSCKGKPSPNNQEVEKEAVFTQETVDTAFPGEPTTPINDKRLMQKLFDSALYFGNINAYNRVSRYYFLEHQFEELFYFAMRMANKYHYPKAYYQVFLAFESPKSGEAFNDVEEESKNLAMYYLLRSYELGYDGAYFTVKDMFKEKKIPVSSEYLAKFNP